VVEILNAILTARCDRDPKPWRESEVHGRRDARRFCFRFDEYVGECQQVCSSVAGKPAPNPAPEGKRCISRLAILAVRALPLRVGQRFACGRICTAISAAATVSNSLHRSRSQSRGCGWNKIAGRLQPPRSWLRRDSPHRRGGCWTELGEFPISGFSKAERVYGLLEKTRIVTPPGCVGLGCEGSKVGRAGLKSWFRAAPSRDSGLHFFSYHSSRAIARVPRVFSFFRC